MTPSIKTHQFSGKKVSYYFGTTFPAIETIVDRTKTIIITDENVIAAAGDLFSGWKTIVIKAGEEHKQQGTVDGIIQQLIAMEADRTFTLVGVGGGVITDITGYAAGIYMRGIKFGFVPTTILAMVDASIGGKNGVDVGAYKNLVGLIRQPDFLLFDYALLNTLPHEQWVNGFAEIIKHACIKDAAMFSLLEEHRIDDFKKNDALLASLIERNVNIKTAVVAEDEFEKGDRKLLNFGHTLGHAVENMHQLLHGHAISIGMMAAALFSEKMNGFAAKDRERLQQLLQKYQLSTSLQFEITKAWELLKLDKKRSGSDMNFILLNRIGDAVVKPLPLQQLEQLIRQNL